MPKGKGTGRIIHESDTEAVMSEKIAVSMEQSLLPLLAGSGSPRIVRTQFHNNVGWHKSALTLVFDNGRAIRISGMDLDVSEVEAPENLDSVEWTKDSIHPQQGMLPQAEERADEEDGA